MTSSGDAVRILKQFGSEPSALGFGKCSTWPDPGLHKFIRLRPTLHMMRHSDSIREKMHWHNDSKLMLEYTIDMHIIMSSPYVGKKRKPMPSVN